MQRWALLLIILFVLGAAGIFGYAGWLAYADAGGLEELAEEAGWQILLIPGAVILGIVILVAMFSKSTARMGQRDARRQAEKDIGLR